MKTSALAVLAVAVGCGLPPEEADPSDSASQALSSIAFVQSVSATAPNGTATVSLTFPNAQAAGNLNVVAVGWNDTTSTVSSISDSRGNVYALAIGPTSGTALRQSIYYAKNIAAGSTTLTVHFSAAAGWPDIRALEYRGADTVAPLDATAGAAGTSTSAASGSLTTHSANELVFAAGMTFAHFTSPSAGFTSRGVTTYGDISQDNLSGTAGSFNPGATNSASSPWVMQAATFRAPSAGAVTLTPTSIDFGSVAVGSASTIQFVTVTNGTAAPLTLGTTLTGSAEFAYGNIGTCKSPLAAGASCTWSLKFSPTSAGAQSATLTQTDSAAGSPRVVTLAGTGTSSSPPPPPPPSGWPVLATPCGNGCNSYWVSPSGSDSAAGTQSAPWKTLKHSIATATIGSAGAVIHAAPGTYSETIDIHRGGTSTSARLMIRCDTKWSVPSGSGCLVRNGSGFIVWAGNYLEIAGFDIANSDAEAAVVSVYSGTAVQSAGGNYVRVLSNYAHDLGQNAYGNVTYPNLKGCPSAGAIAGTTVHGHVAVGFEVLGNRIERIGTKNPMCNQYHGVYIDGSDAVVENNLIIDVAGYGLHIYDAACRERISNNTVIRSGQGGGVIRGSNGCSAGQNTANNNILINNGQAGFHYMGDCGGGGNSLFANNLFFGNAGGDFEWPSGSSNTCDVVQGSLHEDPTKTFVSYSSGDFHLASGSIAVNGGTTACAPGISNCAASVDFDGATRFAIDVGAFER